MSQKISKADFGLICLYDLSSLKSKFEKESSLHKIRNTKFDYFSDIEKIGKEHYPKTYKKILSFIKNSEWLSFDELIKELCENKTPVIFVPVSQFEINKDPNKCGKYAFDVIFLPAEIKHTTFRQRFGRFYTDTKPKGERYKPNPLSGTFVVNTSYSDYIDEGNIAVDDIYEISDAIKQMM
jgi:hypothetical protein